MYTSSLVKVVAIAVVAMLGAAGVTAAAERRPAMIQDPSTSEPSAAAAAGRAFRDAVERKDLEALVATFAEDVEVFSPVLPDPFVGKPVAARLFAILVEEFDDIVVLDEFHHDGRYVLAFSTVVGGQALQVVDLMTVDEHGLIDRFEVTARPLAGIQALAEAVAPHLADLLAS